jgi:hypothetical protein
VQQRAAEKRVALRLAAITVIDTWQGRELGTVPEQLADRAREQGIARLLALTPARNRDDIAVSKSPTAARGHAKSGRQDGRRWREPRPVR